MNHDFVAFAFYSSPKLSTSVLPLFIPNIWISKAARNSFLVTVPGDFKVAVLELHHTV